MWVFPRALGVKALHKRQKTQQGKLRQSIMLSAQRWSHKDIRHLRLVARYVVNKASPVQPRHLHAQGAAECQ